MPSEGDEPLEELYADDEPYNDSELVSVLSDFVKVDRETGAPVPQEHFGEIDPKSQTVALMLYRHVADSLGQLDGNIAIEAMWFDENSEIYEADVMDLLDEFSWVEEELSGQYYVSKHKISSAVNYLADDS